MSDNKKDLTRIEDLGEFIHELEAEAQAQAEEMPPEVPESSVEFGDENFSNSFDTTPSESEQASEELNSFETSDSETFTSSEDSFQTQESDLSSTDDQDFKVDNEANSFSSQEFESTSFESDTFNQPNMSEENSDVDIQFEKKPSAEVEFETSENFDDTEIPPEEPTFVEPPSEKVITEIPTHLPDRPREDFSEIKKFVEDSQVTGMAIEGNPAFSILIKNVRFIEDVEDIMRLLKEYKLISDSEEQMKKRLMRGQLLIPRISEYSAIFMAHKLRRFDIEILLGLSDDIQPPKHHEGSEIGITSRSTIYQNQIHHFDFNDTKMDLSQIILSSATQLDGHQVIKYLGIASEHKMLDAHIVEDEGSTDIPTHYSDLALKLKAHAIKARANAVIGLNYQLTPIPSEIGVNSNKYRLSCTGNLVWVSRL